MPTLVLQLSNIKKGVATPLKDTTHFDKNKTDMITPQPVFSIEEIKSRSRKQELAQKSHL